MLFCSEIERKVRERVALEKRAHGIVEYLSEKTSSEVALRDMVNYCEYLNVILFAHTELATFTK